ncbi:hypothetical protein C8J56DRAFT_1054221 [Mycena floridula]|nr:hypothetical protein C8J56DRAFT_1054221 [Mycena floridula]
MWDESPKTPEQLFTSSAPSSPVHGPVREDDDTMTSLPSPAPLTQPVIPFSFSMAGPTASTPQTPRQLAPDGLPEMTPEEFEATPVKKGRCTGLRKARPDPLESPSRHLENKGMVY